METVQRWIWTDGGMEPYRAHPLNVGGVFVTAEDYDALAARLKPCVETMKRGGYAADNQE